MPEWASGDDGRDALTDSVGGDAAGPALARTDGSSRDAAPQWADGHGADEASQSAGGGEAAARRIALEKNK